MKRGRRPAKAPTPEHNSSAVDHSGGTGRSTDPVRLLCDALARVVAARETADPAERDRLLADLEQDMAEALERTETA